MSGIDATVVLGLAGKVNQVFADDDAYQAFPLAPIGLKADSLQTMVTAPLSTAGANAHAQFSLLVNEIPAGPLWQPDGERLWDVYGDLLTGGVVELLEKPPSAEQKAAYSAAFTLLYTEDEDGIPVPSRTVVAYERHRDAYVAASIEYNNRKGEAETTSDEAVVAAWENDEPVLRDAVDDARAAWSGPGNRKAVESARQVLSEHGSNSPAAVWEGFRKLFNPLLPEIFFRSTLENLSYVPTGYLPSDVTEAGWPRITVTADELKQLAEQAPPELRDRLGGSADAGITMVSFEYSYVTVSRPWFTPQLFSSRAWRFKDTERVLSDGATPPSGTCTAYVTGLVLARNITVHRPAQRADAESPNLGFLPMRTTTMKAQIARPYTVNDMTARVATRQALNARLRAGPVSPPDDDAADRSTDHPDQPARPRIGVLAGDAFGDRRVRVADLFPSMRKTAILSRPIPRTIEVPPEESTTDPDDIFVLAFQCRFLPKSPDPDPDLLKRADDGAADGSATNGQTYTVVKGDTLGKIAARFYGTSGKWRRIYDANRNVIGANPDVIKVGQKLTIP